MGTPQDAVAAADTMAAGLAPGATARDRSQARRAADRWRREHPPRETTTPPVETRSA